MKATVLCVGKEDFTNKSGKTSYVLHLIEITEFPKIRVHRAFTTKAHYDSIPVKEVIHYFDDDEIHGYINFENRYTKFYLPKDEVK